MPEPEEVIELGTAFACLTWNDSMSGYSFQNTYTLFIGLS